MKNSLNIILLKANKNDIIKNTNTKGVLLWEEFQQKKIKRLIKK